MASLPRDGEPVTFLSFEGELSSEETPYGARSSHLLTSLLVGVPLPRRGRRHVWRLYSWGVSCYYLLA